MSAFDLSCSCVKGARSAAKRTLYSAERRYAGKWLMTKHFSASAIGTKRGKQDALNRTFQLCTNRTLQLCANTCGLFAVTKCGFIFDFKSAVKKRFVNVLKKQFKTISKQNRGFMRGFKLLKLLIRRFSYFNLSSKERDF